MRELDWSSDHLSPTLPREMTGAAAHGPAEPDAAGTLRDGPAEPDAAGTLRDGPAEPDAAEPGDARPRPLTAIGVVGHGRVGQALVAALDLAGYDVPGPFGRGERPHGCDAILLCVPDQEIATAAQAVADAAPFVGHTSGATPLTALAPAQAEHAFGLHPLQTITGPPTDLRGCG